MGDCNECRSEDESDCDGGRSAVNAFSSLKSAIFSSGDGPMGGCIDRPSGISEQASAIIGTQDDVQEIAQRLDDAIDDVAGVSSREVSDAEKRVEKVEEAHTHSKSKEEIAARNRKMTEALIHLEKAKHEAKLRESELRREVWSELEVQYGDNFENHVVEAENGWHQRYIWAT